MILEEFFKYKSRHPHQQSSMIQVPSYTSHFIFFPRREPCLLSCDVERYLGAVIRHRTATSAKSYLTSPLVGVPHQIKANIIKKEAAKDASLSTFRVAAALVGENIEETDSTLQHRHAG